MLTISEKSSFYLSEHKHALPNSLDALASTLHSGKSDERAVRAGKRGDRRAGNTSFIDFSTTQTLFGTLFISSLDFISLWFASKPSLYFASAGHNMHTNEHTQRDVLVHQNTQKTDLQIYCMVSSIDFNKSFPTNLISQQMILNVCFFSAIYFYGTNRKKTHSLTCSSSTKYTQRERESCVVITVFIVYSF